MAIKMKPITLVSATLLSFNHGQEGLSQPESSSVSPPQVEMTEVKKAMEDARLSFERLIDSMISQEVLSKELGADPQPTCGGICSVR